MKISKNTIKNLIMGIIALIPLFLIGITLCTPLKNADGGDITTINTTEYTTEEQTLYTIGETTEIFPNSETYNLALKTNYVDLYFDASTSFFYKFKIGISISFSDEIANVNNGVIILCNGSYIELGNPITTQSIESEVYKIIVNDNQFYCYDANNTLVGSFIQSNNYSWDFDYNTYGSYDIKIHCDTLVNYELSFYTKDYCEVYANGLSTSNTYQVVTNTETIEGTRYNYDIINQFINLNKQSPLYEPYEDLLEFLNMQVSNNNVLSVLLLYPIYLFYMIIILIIFEVFSFIPLLLRRLGKRLGGGLDD